MTTTKIIYKASTEEWVVKLYIDGQHVKGANYYTNDEQDAKDTAVLMVKRANETKGQQ